MLQDEDDSVLAASSATVGDLKFLDENVWADRLVELHSHEASIVRRNIVISLRDYVERFPEDERKLIPSLWNDGDEVVQIRLRELLMRMDEIDPKRLSKHIPLLREDRLQSLWDSLDARRSERSMVWKQWLAGESEVPEPIEVLTDTHVSSGEEPTELPNLDDALDMLDDTLGYLD